MTRRLDLPLLGVSFRTAPVAVPDALHVDREQALGFLQELSADHPELEVLVVSTCNRSEFYLLRGEDPGADALCANAEEQLLRVGLPRSPAMHAAPGF